jgi:hypothetical protein
LNALGEGSIALRGFGLPVWSRLGSDGAIKSRLVGVRTSEADSRFQVHRLIEGDAVEPGSKFSLTAKRLERVMNFEKYLLCHVFGFRDELAAQNRNREPKYESAVPVNQFRECLLVAGLSAGYELGIGIHHSSHQC